MTTSRAASPGSPTKPSTQLPTSLPWSPPGPKWLSLNSGATNFASTIDVHIMTSIRHMNHFSRLGLKAFISLSETSSMNTGMRNAGMPKHCFIKK